MRKRIIALLLALTLAGSGAAAVPAYAEENETADTVKENGVPGVPEESEADRESVEAGNESEITSVEISGEYNKLDESEIVNEASGDLREKEARTYAADGTDTYADTASGSIISGALADGTAYELPDELLNYDSEYVPTRQFACPERNGVYFLQADKLYFLDLTSGSYKKVYNFGWQLQYFYCDGEILYWMDQGAVARYDLNGQCTLESIPLDGMGYWASYGIGVDQQGRIYLYGRREQDEEYSLLLFAADGTYLDSKEQEDRIYDFIGFRQDGMFFYVGYYNYIYWGYEHDMDALFAGELNGNAFSDDQFILIENVGQQYFSEHQDYAALLTDDLLADHMGNVFDVSKLNDLSISNALVFSRKDDEDLSDYGDLGSIGTRMVYSREDNTVTAYTSGKNMFVYDVDTGETLKRYSTQHFVFSLLDYGDRLVAIERENDIFYIEMIGKDDFRQLQEQVINLNERNIYSTHTKEAVEEQYEKAKITDDIKIYRSQYTLSPYKESVLTEEIRNALLDYSNYMRWLGGLTPFESASDDIWTEEARGALILTKTNNMSHSPEQPSDMDDAFFESAYNACSNSNLYGGGVSEGRASSFMSYIEGWLDDTANVSNLPLGHRFEFLQRAGYQLSYGATDRYLAQRIEVYDNQINATGTVEGVDNNDYCYTWPGAGYFPTEHISTRAQWSICLNEDMIDLSNKALRVTITDLDTGEVTDVTSSLGSSAYYGVNQYFGYFKGKFFYFDPPEADDYSGKNYKVTVSNLELSTADPATIEYTIHFFDVEPVRGDADGDGIVNISDLRMILRHVCGKIQLNAQQLENADVVSDGKVDIQDLRKVLRFICGKLSEL